MLRHLKYIYKVLIIFYTPFLLYLMFFGFGRTVMSFNIVRLIPFVSTYNFITNAVSMKTIFLNIVGNLLMFLPFGFLGWIFPTFNNWRKLMLSFLFAIIVLETLQYITRLGVFDIDDIILNSISVYLGFILKKIIENQFPSTNRGYL